MRFILLIFTLCVLTISTTLQAQDTPLQLPIQIVVPSDLETFGNQILEEFEDKVAGQGIFLIQRNNDVHMQIRIQQDNQTDQIYIDMITNYSPLREISSMLNFSIGLRQIVEMGNEEEVINWVTDLALGLSLYTSGQCAEFNQFAATILSKSQRTPNLKRDNFYAVYYLQGNCALLENDYQGAISLYNQALQYRDSEPPIALSQNMAWAFLQLGQSEKAKEVMDKLLDTFSFLELGGGLSTYHEIIIARAEIYALAGDYDTATEAMNSLIENRPGIADFHVIRGQMYRAIYEWDNALADFNTALELTPDYAEAYYQRGLLYYSILQTGTETRDEALADFQRYLKLAPEGPFAVEATRYAESIQAELDALNG